MDDLETNYHRKDQECPTTLHDLVPIIEGSQTVGVVCLICGKSVREDMTYSKHVVSEKGLVQDPRLFNLGGLTDI